VLDLKELIISAWEKKRLPSFFKKFSRKHVKYYDKFNKECSIIGFFPPCYIVNVFYSYSEKYLCCYIDEISNEEKEWIIEDDYFENVSNFLFVRGKNVLYFEVKK